MAFAASFKHDAPVKMMFTERLTDGICYTNDEKYVRDNCQRLSIELDEIEENNSAIEIHHFHHFLVYTAKNSGKLEQYVFPASANRSSIENIAASFPPEAANLLLEKGDFGERTFFF